MRWKFNKNEVFTFFILLFFNRLPAQEGVGVLRSFLRRPPVPGYGNLCGCGDIRKKRRRTPTTDQLSLKNTHIVAENCPCGRACENAWHELARDKGERNERHGQFSAFDLSATKPQPRQNKPATKSQP